MAVTNDQITSWLQSNPGATDATIASTMQQFNVTPAQMAQATGLDTGAVQTRYDAALPAPAAVVAAPNYEQMVQDAYGSIGRTGFGTGASNIDQAGFDYWLNTLQSGASTPDAFQRNFQTAVSDYVTKNPQDQYSSYVTDFLTDTSPAVAAETNKAFGVGSDVPAYFNQNPDVAAEYTKNSMGMSPQQFAEAHYAKYGSGEGRNDLATSGILSGFKYANDSGLSEAAMRRTLGDDVFNTYKTKFADYAKTGIANILADDKLSFDEARTAVKFGRDYGYDAQKLADLTGQKKEFFDTVNKTYDETADKIIDSVLGAEGVKTDADRAVQSLRLQSTYGFTDEDLAKATGYDAKKLKADLDPVRNFGTDLNKILTNTDSTLADTKKFLETAKTNGTINQLYGTNLNTLDTKIAEIEDRWKDFKDVEPMHAQRVFDQIGGQREKLGGQYYRGVFGDPMTMAATLARKGIDTLADIGQKDKYEATPAEKRYFAPDGTPVYDFGNGTFGVSDGVEGYSRTVPKDQVKTEYGYTKNELRSDSDGDYYEAKFVPLSADEIDKDGNYQKLVGKVAIDKDTGKEIADLNGQIAGQNSSGGFNKKWNTLNVAFTKEGVPVVTASSQKSGLGALVQDLAPMISMALPFVLPGLGSALSGMLPGAGAAATATSAAVAPTLVNQALTQGILGGGFSALSGGDFGKGFLGGAVNPFINTGISSLLPTGLSETAANAIRGAGTGVVRGVLQGGDFKDLLGQGVLSGLTNYGLGEATSGLNLTPQQLNFATGIALPLLQGKDINPMSLIGTLVNADQQRQKSNSNVDFGGGGGGDDIDALMGGGYADDGGDSGNLGYNQPLDQQSLNNTFTGNGPSNFYGANMTGNSNNQSLIAQIAQTVSRGVPLGGGYIKPAKIGSGYGARWSKQFNEGGMVDADQQMQRTTS